MLLTVLVGCGRRQELVTEYGKVVGDQGGTSVNGTSVLFEMLRENGFRVKRYRKISPRLNRYNTIVWFPNDQGCPSSEATNALENWLTEGYLRTLIYVGRDYQMRKSIFINICWGTARSGSGGDLSSAGGGSPRQDPATAQVGR